MKKLPFIFALLIGTLLLGASKPGYYDSRSQSLKAEYLFLQSEEIIELGDDESHAYTMMRQAKALDPTNLDISSRMAQIDYDLEIGDSAAHEVNYATMLSYFLENPTDVSAAGVFLTAAQERGDVENTLRVYEQLFKHCPDRNDIALRYVIVLADIADAEHPEYLDSAMRVCDQVAARIDDEANLDVLSHRLFLHHHRADTAAFIEEIGRFRKVAPNSPEMNVSIAGVYEMIQYTDSAMACYNRANELDPSFGPAVLGRANLYRLMGDTVGYSREVENVIKSPGLEFEDKYEMLRSYTGHLINDTVDGRRDIAAMLDVMQNLHPAEPKLHALHGAFLYVARKNEEAKERFGYAIDLDPEEEDYYLPMIDASFMSGDTIGAIEVGRRAFERFDDASYAITTALYLSVLEQNKAALALLDSVEIDAVKDYERASNVYSMRGDLFWKLDSADRAFEEYEIAIALNPYNSMAMNNAAYFMAVEGRDLDRALTLTERAVSLDDNPTNLDTYAWVLFKRKEYQAAREQIDKALLHYDDPTDSVEVAESLEDTVAVEAVDSVEMMDVADAVVIKEPSAEVFDHAGDIYFMTGEPEMALRFWELAQALDPKNEKIRKKVTHKTYFFE